MNCAVASIVALLPVATLGASPESPTLHGQPPPADQVAGADDVLRLSPFKVFGSTVAARFYFDQRGDKNTIKYIKVMSVAAGSMADRAGLKKGDLIVAIADLRLEGLTMAALEGAKLRAKQEADIWTVTYAVRRSKAEGEVNVVFRYPRKINPPDAESRLP